MLGVSPTTARGLTVSHDDSPPRLPVVRVRPSLPRVGLNTIEEFMRGRPGVSAVLPEGLPAAMSLVEVGTVLGVSHDVVRRLVTDGELEAFRVTRMFRVTREALQAWIEGHG
ncbi:hypothetical protein AESSP_02682 [Aestuariimicrobium sp. T2.26MG-19.2B]|nr:hypothetical protein AESSP_02682 [Aestuariimicrobium sp. T2.26MG-19.2B]